MSCNRREHHQERNLTRKNPKIGELLLLHDEDTHREYYKAAKIRELPLGRNQPIKVAKLRLTADVVVERLINHL